MTPRPHKGRPRSFLARLAPVAALLLAILPLPSRAQEKPTITIEHDCQKFAISNDNKIACSVPHVKRMKKIIIQRDDVWVANANGKEKQIVEGEKFVPVPPPSSYIVDSLSWAPDGRRIAMNMTTMHPSSEDEPAGGAKVIALLDEEGHEIKVEGSKTRFIENAINGTWLADGQTVVYLTGAGPYRITRVRVSGGESMDLFAGATFDAVAWDTRNNQAFALGQSLSITGRLELVQLDLVHETVHEVTRLDTYQGQLSVSPSGRKIAFFADGDTIEVRDLANPSKPTRVRAGFGQFQWSHDEQRVLLKRGPAEKSGDLVWVGIYKESFVPALFGLDYHAFAIAPNGEFIAVTEPGRAILRVFPLP